MPKLQHGRGHRGCSDGRTSNYGSMFVRFETFDSSSVRSRFDKKSSKGSRTFDNMAMGEKWLHIAYFSKYCYGLLMSKVRFYINWAPKNAPFLVNFQIWCPICHYFFKSRPKRRKNVICVLHTKCSLMFEVRSRFDHVKFGSFEVR